MQHAEQGSLDNTRVGAIVVAALVTKGTDALKRKGTAMKTKLRVLVTAAMLGLAMLLAACGGGNAGGGTASGGNAGGGAAGTTIDISADGENLAFDQTTLSATAGQQVTLRFQNSSAVQQHNWVLVQGGGAEAQAIADAGVTAGAEAQYLPTDRANVAASTEVLEPGETGEVTFTAPSAGTYLYICTVPGHYPLMQGTMTVN
jgi:azurin